MKATFVNIEVDRDPMTKIPKCVAAWEVPIYESKFGEGIVIGDEVEVETGDMPELQEEFARLVAVHGVDEATRQPHAEIAYGRGSQALKALNAAIHEAYGKKVPAKSKKAADTDDDDSGGNDGQK